jgi:hypothetical protein
MRRGNGANRGKDGDVILYRLAYNLVNSTIRDFEVDDVEPREASRDSEDDIILIIEPRVRRATGIGPRVDFTSEKLRLISTHAHTFTN